MAMRFEEMKTFKDLYETLKSYDDVSQFRELLASPVKGKDIQESCLRLFAKLGCIESIASCRPCIGNFNLSKFVPIKSKYEIFFKDNRLIFLKDSGDAADLVLLNYSKDTKRDRVYSDDTTDCESESDEEEDQPKLLVFTSKNVKNIRIGNLDIDKIKFYHENKYRLQLGICIPSKTKFDKAVDRASLTTLRGLKTYIDNAIIIDHNDLVDSYDAFKKRYTQRD